jgi:hypothetical protein
MLRPSSTRPQRARLLEWRTLGLIAGAVASFAATGCDDISAGQPAVSKDPPRLVRLTVQDQRGLGGAPSPAVGFAQRDSVVDLLDDDPPQACSYTQPCLSQYTIDFTFPKFACSVTEPGEVGVCGDPIKLPASGLIPLSVPLGTAGDAGSGMQIRLVFDKILDNSIEEVTTDPSKGPGMTNTYKLRDGIVELDAGGTKVDTVNDYDAGGSSTFTADIMLVPFGPAVIIKPKAPLAPDTTYTVKILDPGALKDKDGRPALGKHGDALATTFTFKTEPLTGNAAASFPDFSADTVEIKPNDVLQFAFWSPLREATAMVTLTGPGGAVATVAYLDRGADPMACDDALNPFILDIAHDGGGGMPADWAAGAYTLTFTVADDVTGGSTFSSGELKFTVAGDADPMSATGFQSHVTPGQCQ